MSRKRKSFESRLGNTMTGVFTRSKTRIFVHSNRSGRSRINNSKALARHCFSLFPNERPHRKRRRNDLITQSDELSSISVKDLRAHRVFSTNETQGFEEFAEKSTGLCERKEDLDCMQATPPEPEVAGCRYEDKNEELQKDEAVNDAGDKKPRVSPTNKSVPSSRARVKIYKFPGSLSYRRLLPSLMEVAKEISCIDSNSSALLPVVANQAKDGEKKSDGDLSSVLNVGNIIENQVLMVEENGLAGDQEAGQLTNCANQTVPLGVSLCDAEGNNSAHCVEKKEGDSNNAIEKGGFENDLSMKSPTADKEIGVAVKVSDQAHGKVSSKSVPRIIKLASDRKIARTGMGLKQCSRLKGSFAYRRLLPYLREINMDSSRNYFLKVDKKPQESTQTPLRSSSDVIGLNSESFRSGSDSMPQSTEGPHTLQEEAVLATSDHASDIAQLNPTTLHNDTEEKVLPIVKASSNIDSHAEANTAALISVDRVSPPKPLCAIVYSESPPKYPLVVAKQVSPAIKGVSTGTVVTGASNSANSVDVGRLHESSHSVPSDPINVLSTVSRKCILKRNPRGCRGLCSCLNCASFRLHAERAFEFSKHQMQDAEEVALDLINELSSLRSMLEESVVRPDCCQSYVKQVKEACEKASETEEVARTRISQMNYELDVHSRITCKYEPRVRFDNKVKVKVIP